MEKSKFDRNENIVYADLSLNADSTNKTNGNHRLENDLINDIKIDNQGNVWILLFRDDILARYNPHTDKMTRYNIYELAGSYPSKIEKDRAGRIWCVFNGGAIIFNERGENRIIHYAEPTEDEGVLAVGAVGNDVWISTHSNMWKINGQTLEASILPIPQKAYTAIYEDSQSGKILLGGTDEIIEIITVR